MRISIFGLGYVGAVTAACLADSGHEVTAFDVDAARLAALAAGRAPVEEPGLSSLIARHVAGGSLRAVPTAAAAVAQSDLSMICVGTPPGAEGQPDLTALRAACAAIGAGIRAKTGWHAVVQRSTVLPGTARDVTIPCLSAAAGRDFGFCVHPEFLREATAVADYLSPSKIVIGQKDSRTAQDVLSLYDGIDAPRALVAPEVAEAVKYADNAWHALKVGFANEMGNALQSFGVDSHVVMDVFCLDTRLNISPAYLRPGFAYGGSCLPKDLQALSVAAQLRGVDIPLLSALVESNARQILKARDMVLSAGRKDVGLMGLSFKQGSGDLRGSPLVQLAELLISEGVDLTIYDPGVAQTARSLPPPVAQRLVADADAFAARAQMFVVGHHDRGFSKILASPLGRRKPVVDLVRLEGADDSQRAYAGISW